MEALTQIATFGGSAAAIEKVLRLAQSIVQIGATVPLSVKGAAPWNLAKSQFNLSRRFLRLHKWIENFTAAYEAHRAENVLEAIKFMFLGLYFLTEMLTITDVMGLTSMEWGPWLVKQGNQFWFYGLVCSLLLGNLNMFFGPGPKPDAEPEKPTGMKEVKEKEGEVAAEAVDDFSYSQTLIDMCDLVIPGSNLGWTPLSPLFVSVAMSISTLLALFSMWGKIHSQAATQSQKAK